MFVENPSASLEPRWWSLFLPGTGPKTRHRKDSAMQVQYYEPITRVNVPNIHVLPMLLQMRCYGQSACGALHLEVNHASSPHDREDPICRSRFHKALLVDVEETPRLPYRKGLLKLEGKFRGRPRVGYKCDLDIIDIFALLEFNLGVLENSERPLYPKITFSPIVFGSNCRPKLPYNDSEQLKHFLQVVRKVLLSSEPQIDCTSISQTTLQILEWLGVISEVSDPLYKVTMLPQQFETIFGVKLP